MLALAAQTTFYNCWVGCFLAQNISPHFTILVFFTTQLSDSKAWYWMAPLVSQWFVAGKCWFVAGNMLMREGGNEPIIQSSHCSGTTLTSETGKIPKPGKAKGSFKFSKHHHLQKQCLWAKIQILGSYIRIFATKKHVLKFLVCPPRNLNCYLNRTNCCTWIGLKVE